MKPTRKLSFKVSLEFDQPIRDPESIQTVAENIARALYNEIQSSEKGLAPDDNFTMKVSIIHPTIQFEESFEMLDGLRHLKEL